MSPEPNTIFNLETGQTALSKSHDGNFCIRNNGHTSIGLEGYVLTQAGRQLVTLETCPDMDGIIKRAGQARLMDLEWGKGGLIWWKHAHAD